MRVSSVFLLGLWQLCCGIRLQRKLLVNEWQPLEAFSNQYNNEMNFGKIGFNFYTNLFDQFIELILQIVRLILKFASLTFKSSSRNQENEVSSQNYLQTVRQTSLGKNHESKDSKSIESLEKMKGYIDELGKVRKRLDLF